VRAFARTAPRLWPVVWRRGLVELTSVRSRLLRFVMLDPFPPVLIGDVLPGFLIRHSIPSVRFGLTFDQGLDYAIASVENAERLGLGLVVHVVGDEAGVFVMTHPDPYWCLWCHDSGTIHRCETWEADTDLLPESAKAALPGATSAHNEARGRGLL
jgi:hypothetical protein